MSKDSSAQWYQKNKEMLQKSYPKQKKRKSDNMTERYKNLPEDEKQRLAEYRKNIINEKKDIQYFNLISTHTGYFFISIQIFFLQIYIIHILR